MFTRSSLIHLRIPFSLFLLPVFLFAMAHVQEVDITKWVLVFVSLHFFLYPASNGYNSYFDKDEGSIGGLKKPPKVKKDLYFLSLLFDVIALVLGLMVSIEFAVFLLIYGMVSKGYSHPKIRFKKYPYLSWLIIGVFQGAFTYAMVYLGLTGANIGNLLSPNVLFPASLSTILLLGSYPMTQVYQHKEDQERGDITLSLKLGVKGTFVFTMIVFGLASALFFLYFQSYFSVTVSWVFLVAMFPVVAFFSYWFILILRNQEKANFENTMRLNLISSVSLSTFFIYLATI